MRTSSKDVNKGEWVRVRTLTVQPVDVAISHHFNYTGLIELWSIQVNSKRPCAEQLLPNQPVRMSEVFLWGSAGSEPWR